MASPRPATNLLLMNKPVLMGMGGRERREEGAVAGMGMVDKVDMVRVVRVVVGRKKDKVARRSM